MTDKLYVFLSYWGHILSLDKSQNKVFCSPLLHTSLDEILTFEGIPNHGNHLVAENSNPSFSKIQLPWFVNAHSSSHYISFQHNGKWICSHENGNLTYAEKQSDWEYFLPVSLSDMHHLKSFLLKNFYVPVNEDVVPLQLGLRNFNLVFGQKEFPLHLNLQYLSLANSDGLFLTDGNCEFQIKRVQPKFSDPLIWIDPKGNICNRALQYLTAEGIRQFLPNAKISNIQLEMFGILRPSPPPTLIMSAQTGELNFSIDTKGLASCLARGEVNSIMVEGFTFCVDHYPTRNKCRELIPSAIGTESITGFNDKELVCNIRGSEILHGIHPDYIVMPASYYKLLEEETGLELVFFGQIGDDAYSNHLKESFPSARFVPSQGPAVDFEILRRSKNIAIAVSTFSWLAAWLSHADNIFIPVGGMFNPIQHPNQSYLPLDDPHFKYVSIPLVKMVNLFNSPNEFWKIMDFISENIRFISVSELKELMSRLTSWPLSKRVMVGGFDSEYFCGRYPEYASKYLSLVSSPLSSYLSNGDYKTQIVDFDNDYYAENYPDAVQAVSDGDFFSLHHHFVSVGFAMGYTARSD